jgi:hypothetical protein
MITQPQILVYDGKDIGEYFQEPEFGNTWSVYCYITDQSASHIVSEADARSILIEMYQEYE